MSRYNSWHKNSRGYVVWGSTHCVVNFSIFSEGSQTKIGDFLEKNNRILLEEADIYWIKNLLYSCFWWATYWPGSNRDGWSCKNEGTARRWLSASYNSALERRKILKIVVQVCKSGLQQSCKRFVFLPYSLQNKGFNRFQYPVVYSTFLQEIYSNSFD